MRSWRCGARRSPTRTMPNGPSGPASSCVDAVRRLGDEIGLPGLAARAGVVTGEAAITVGAVGQGMVAGDVVNTASRLQWPRRPGTVLVDDATSGCPTAIAFEPAGSGPSGASRCRSPAWEAARSWHCGTGGRTGSRARSSDGRTSWPVKDLLEPCATSDRRGCSIFGQRGLGKSRLAWELEKYVDGVVEPIPLASGAVARVWRGPRVLGARGDGPAARPDRRGRRTATCPTPARRVRGRFIPDEAERRWIEQHLAALIGVGPAPGGERAEAFVAWRTFFERVADPGTTVLVFDDLHWADAGLLDFIEYLVQDSTGRPILVVTLARPSLLEARPDWGIGRRNYVGLHLDPLPRAAMAELLGGLAPGLPAAVSERILDRAEGVPLYAVEILRMLVDRGELEAIDGTYQVRGRLDRLAVPETLQALVGGPARRPRAARAGADPRRGGPRPVVPAGGAGRDRSNHDPGDRADAGTARPA